MPLHVHPPLPLFGWRIPRRIELVYRDGLPVVDFAAPSTTKKKSGRRKKSEKAEAPTWARVDLSADILTDFRKLSSAGPRATLTFARRYGPLRLNSIGLPSGQAIENRAGELTRPARFEAVERWRFYSRLANAVLELAAALRQGSEGSDAVWEPIVAGWKEAFGSMPWRRPDDSWREREVSPDVASELSQFALRPSSRFIRRRLPPAEPSPFLTEAVTGLVDWWLRTGHVGPSLQWHRSGPLVAPGLEVHQRWKELLLHEGFTPPLSREPMRWGAVALAPGLIEGPQFATRVGGAWGALGLRLAEAVFNGANEPQQWCQPGKHWFPLEEGGRYRRSGAVVCCKRKDHQNQARGIRKARQADRERVRVGARKKGGARRGLGRGDAGWVIGDD